MAQSNTAVKVETTEEKIARLESENAQMKRMTEPQKATGPTPASIDVVVDGTKYIASHKDFQSGSNGFHANGKIKLVDGKRYTVNVLLVEIGSKPSK